MLIDTHGRRVCTFGKKVPPAPLQDPQIVTYDFWVRAFVPGLTDERYADLLQFVYEGAKENPNVRVTDVCFTDQKLDYGDFGANYELHGKVTFAVVDHATDASSLSEFFWTKLVFRNALPVNSWRSIGDSVEPL
jgi:hypothetical protein